MGVSIFTHGDTDGLCAGAIVLAAHAQAQVFFTNPYRLIEDLNKTRETDDIIICDISLQENKLTQILDRFSEISRGTTESNLQSSPG